MKERYEIETVEQLRAIADTLRIRIIDLLGKQPMTVTQLGEQLGLTPAKVHYHVRELERVGLLELVETREKGGILEKYYQPIALVISVDKALLTAPLDETQAALRGLLEQISDGYLRSFRQRLGEQEDAPLNTGMISVSHLYLTREEQRQVSSQIYKILEPFENRRGIEGEKDTLFALLSYSLAPEQTEPEEETPPLKINRVWIVGAADYTRSDLLKVRTEHRRLRISVIGLCRFATDISADLIDETIESFTIVGKLIASAEIRQILKQKEEPES